jgi:[CysO sulfur-carrier protein]-S-L-cysteine hydrolase
MLIDKKIVEQITRHAERDTPIEACGYLAGSGRRITRSYQLTNADKSAEHFSFEPVEQFTALKLARKEGLEIIGVYHSHPVSPARPSDEDVKLAIDPYMIYMIVSLKDGKKDVKAFRIRLGEVEEEELIIYER